MARKRPVLSFLCAVTLAWILFSPVILPPAQAAEYRVSSETFLHVFERDTSTGTEELVSPAYQYLGMDVSDLPLEGLSFHAYGWGRHDLSTSGFYEDDSDGELLYAYVDYTTQDSPVSARLGRQYIFSGVTSEAVDGLWLKTDLNRYLSISGYAGQPVGLSSTDSRSGDSIYGGRATVHGSEYEAGLSYKIMENDGLTIEDQLGFDLSIALPMNIDFYGRSIQNLETEEWAEHTYELNITSGSLRVRPFFEYYSFPDYFDTGAVAINPFSILAQSDEEITTIGADLSWKQSESLDIGTKLKTYSYDQNQSSNFMSVFCTWHSDEAELTQVGAEVGYMMGDAAANDYLLLRIYTYMDELGDRLWLDFVSADLVYAMYDQSIYGKDTSLVASAGVGKSFMDDQLTIRLSGDFSQDPYFDDDVRGLLRITYAFDSRM